MASIFLNLDTQLINIYGLLAKGLGCWSIRPDFPDLIVRGISMAELVFDLSEVNDKHHRGLKYSFFTSMQHLRWRRYPTGKYNFRVINNRTILTHFSPIPTNARRVFHVETMWKQLFHLVSTWSTRGMFVSHFQFGGTEGFIIQEVNSGPYLLTPRQIAQNCMPK